MSGKIVPFPDRRMSLEEALAKSLTLTDRARAVERAAVVRWLLTNGHHDAAREIAELQHMKEES
jgi:hypothetical protein